MLKQKKSWVHTIMLKMITLYSLIMDHPVSSDIKSPCINSCHICQGWVAGQVFPLEKFIRVYQVLKLIVPGGWWRWAGGGGGGLAGK